MNSPTSALTGVGKLLIAAGLVIAAVGLVAYIVGRCGGHWRALPGDFVMRRPGFTVYVPLGTSILLSVLLTIGWYVVSLLRR